MATYSKQLDPNLHWNISSKGLVTALQPKVREINPPYPVFLGSPPNSASQIFA